MAMIAAINYIELVDDGFGELEPVIAGTRITVHDIANMYVHNQSPLEWIVENFDLSPAQIHAAISYYYDHKEQIDRELEEGDALARELGKPLKEAIAELKARLKDK